jgi:hypothetical protein
MRRPHPDATAASTRGIPARAEVPGVVEAEGAVELHHDGFRAERARPHALFAGPHANAQLVRRLAGAYGIEAVAVGDADAIVAWCRARGLGVTQDVLERLLGPEVVAEARRVRRRRARLVGLRIAAAVAAIAVLVGVGLAATGSPGDRTLSGRTGEIRVR